MICKNEAANLRRSLPALKWCDDVVVVDSFSDDDTVKVAGESGARVVQRKFDGYGTQKRFAVGLARHDWVLNIDADEVLSDELIQELTSLPETVELNAYSIPRRHVFMGHIFRYGHESALHLIRLFNKTMCNFDEAPVHEKVVTKGKTGRLRSVMLHYSYRDLNHFFEKLNSYSHSGAVKLRDKGRSRPLFLCLAWTPFYFIKHYFIYLNILNGKAGLIWSVLNAWYHTAKYLKLYELNHKS